ncbi:DUF4194 domain-containing protein [Algiphilus sp.]|uniref:DUF4194 domain-containing protein n=1 Tax=Algiphilus sp. TaxID=1872431 RepID=UPI0032EC2E6B
MPKTWNLLVEGQTQYREVDFQRAAMRLFNEQVLYQSNPQQRTDYDLVVRYLREFQEALWLFGCVLDHNEAARYVAAVPKIPEGHKIGLKQSLLALVLAQLYDHHMGRGTLDKGVAGVSMSELAAAYKAATQRDLSLKPQNEIMGLLDDMKRWGIARAAKTEEFGEPTWYVEILPGIQSLINQASLARLKAHAEALFEPDSPTAGTDSINANNAEAEA